MIKNVLFLMALAMEVTSIAQQKPDSVIVELGNASKMVLTIQDRKDIPILLQYDYQLMLTDILNQLDTTPLPTHPERDVKSNDTASYIPAEDHDRYDHHRINDNRHRTSRRSRHSFNFDLGTNNYLRSGKFPDETDELYSVRPWGSWYVGIHSIQHTHIGGKFFIEWGLGMSWYNFKFQKDNVVISKNENGVVFAEDTRDLNFIKSKLSASYVNASFIPLLDFGGRGKKSRYWHSYGSHFRIGAGPYAGYRLGSHSKLQYEDKDKENEKNRDHFYLNNFRYGLRLQVGVRSTDLFFNYDLNELFNTSRPNNPRLNALSFGFIF